MHKAMRSTFAESCGKTNEPPQVEALRGFGEGVIFLRGSDRHRSGDLSIKNLVISDHTAGCLILRFT